MDTISWPSIACYCVFSVFVYYQQLHGKDFRGGSVAFGLVLNLFAIAGMIVGLVYLGYYAWLVKWWVPLLTGFLGIVATLPGVLVERFVGKFTMSIAGFIVWPVSAYYMFRFIPSAA